jgi:6-phosphogluconate dehydrogenase
MTDNATLCDIGFIGLGVMGKNLALNLADNGYKIAAFDLDTEKVDDAIKQDSLERAQYKSQGEEATGQRIFPCTSYTELLSKLKAPHLIIISVPAGAPVDDVCHKLIDAGIQADDIIVDTGNSLWTDTVEREKRYDGKFLFFTTAVSGGEVGARFGASLMPSGDRYAWTRIAPMFKAIAAKVDPATGKPIERFVPGDPVKEGEPCATYIGEAGSGHYVKMVHNGIEYADMQLICEAYNIMRSGLDMTPIEIASVFKEWNDGELNSYLMGISAEVLEELDEETQQPLVDVILDKAGQKGTGLWTAVGSLQIGAPAPTIASAVYARALSTLKDDRVAASTLLAGPDIKALGLDKSEVIDQLKDALYCSKICAYAQGFHLMSMAGKEYGWTLDFAGIAKIWRAGCIIRAVFLQSIAEAYEREDDLANLLVDPFFAKQISKYQHNWRRTVANSSMMGIPIGAFSSALAYYDSYRSETLPANLLQAQRDYFGAHTFERVDKLPGKKYHVEWSKPGRPMVKIK